MYDSARLALLVSVIQYKLYSRCKYSSCKYREGRTATWVRSLIAPFVRVATSVHVVLFVWPSFLHDSPVLTAPGLPQASYMSDHTGYCRYITPFLPNSLP